MIALRSMVLSVLVLLVVLLWMKKALQQRKCVASQQQTSFISRRIALAIFLAPIAVSIANAMPHAGSGDTFKEWKERLFSERPPMEVLVRRIQTTGTKEDVRHFYIVSDRTRFTAIQSRDQLTLDAPYLAEPSRNTKLFGFDGSSYWLINHIGAHTLRNLEDVPEGTEAGEFARSFKNTFMLEVRDILHVGLYNLPIGGVAWDGMTFASTNVYGEAVMGEIMELDPDALPHKIKYTITIDLDTYEAFIQYTYFPRLEVREHPSSILIGRDQAMTDLQTKRYEVLAARFANDPERLLSMHQYLSPRVGTITHYKMSGGMDYGPFQFEENRHIYVLGRWMPQRNVTLAALGLCAVVLTLPVVILFIRNRRTTTV
jgi:hypothetical protein